MPKNIFFGNIMVTLGDFSEQNEQKKVAKTFSCSSCDYVCSKKYNLERHISTCKEKMMHKSSKMVTLDEQNEQNEQNEQDKQNSKIVCKCGKTYKHKQGLWRHKQTCEKISSEEPVQNTSVPQITPELVLMLVQQNKEMQNIVMEVVKGGTTNHSHNTNANNTNSHNKTFNLQFFLNDTCKNAMNIDDFVNDIVLTLKDLEDTGRLGFAEGISKIINRRLKELSVTERPIHCSDAKRETLYVKDKNKWEKENEDTPILTKAVKNIAGKNMMQIFDWQKAHPDYSEPDTRTSDKYMKMLTNVMSGGTEEEINANYDKIVRNIIKEVPIDKEHFSV